MAIRAFLVLVLIRNFDFRIGNHGAIIEPVVTGDAGGIGLSFMFERRVGIGTTFMEPVVKECQTAPARALINKDRDGFFAFRIIRRHGR
jgi:hypothetical protein